MNRCLAERAWLIRLAALLLCACGTGHSQTTTRVSVSSQGVQGNDHSGLPFSAREGRPLSVSRDGRFVAFWSSASNLVPGDTLGWDDIFVHDRQTGLTSRVSVASGGAAANGDSESPSISADGRYIAFQSGATNLGGNQGGAFVHDRQTGQTSRVSIDAAGVPVEGIAPSISADGRLVAFRSAGQVYVRDRQAATTRLVSVNSMGVIGNDQSWEPAISGDGRFVAFCSWASNLVDGDTNGFQDVFVHALHTNETFRASVSSSGAEADGPSGGEFLRAVDITSDGRFVLFRSAASNIAVGSGGLIVRDLATGVTLAVTAFFCPEDSSVSISDDGRFVTFAAAAIEPQNKHHQGDVYLVDRAAGTTSVISVGVSGEPHGYSVTPAISANGRLIAFASNAFDLVTGDTNDKIDVFVRPRTTCSGDVNGNGVVDFVDLNLVLATYGLCGASALGDANGDGCVNFLDLNIVLGAFGTEC